MGWEHFPHGADIGIRGWGPTPAAAFEEAGLALTAIVVEPASVKREIAVDIALDAPTLDDLFVEWLNALIFEMATRQAAFGAFRVRILNEHLQATAFGERIDPERHDVAVEPKGATYTALQVAQMQDGAWQAQCVVDV
jgi:tRNA nucleotidyltransferase (CCA-adding enzyme)